MAGNHTHVAVGILAGVSVASVLGLSPEATVIFAFTSGGAALLPDLDDVHSAATHAGGVLLAAPLWVFRRLAIRHRGPTHTLVGSIALAWAIYWLGQLYAQKHGHWPAHWPIRLLVPFLLSVLATRSLLRIGSGENIRPLLKRRYRFYIEIIVGLMIGYIGFTLGPTAHFVLGMALAVGIGALSHALIDIPFESGVPLFWPFVWSLNMHVAFGHHEVGGPLDHFITFVAMVATILIVAFGTLHGGPLILRSIGHIHP